MTTDGLNPGAWALDAVTNRSALVRSEITSPNDAFSDEAKTPMLTTRVRPIIRAAAVEEVRRGLRVAFCFARLTGQPAPPQGRDQGREGSDDERQRDDDAEQGRSQSDPEHHERRTGVQQGQHGADTGDEDDEPDDAAPPGRPLRPGVESRRASTGSTWVARRAGTSAATTVTTVPSSRHSQTVRGSTCRDVLGSVKPTKSMSHLSPRATRTPRPTPMADAPAPIMRASSNRLRSTCRRVAPMARSSAISRERWVTIIVKVFQMMNEPTNSATCGEDHEQDLDDLQSSSIASEFSWATVAPVTASVPSGRPRSAAG